jgi:hypothetical protein
MARFEAHIEQDWQRATEADPRIALLAEVAYDLVRTGGQDSHSSALVYGDLKPYLGRLVGWSRGQPPVISQPYTGRPDADAFLRSDRAYDVCHDVIFTRLCDIYDGRWRSPDQTEATGHPRLPRHSAPDKFPSGP